MTREALLWQGTYLAASQMDFIILSLLMTHFVIYVAFLTGMVQFKLFKGLNEIPLRTYYPIRFNSKGEPTPLWRSYLFIEFREGVTINLCRTTTHFIRVVSEKDKDGLVTPVMVRRNGIQENMAMVLQGKFNQRQLVRQFYGKGSFVRVLDGTFIDKKVRLEEDIFPD
jgi:hypothetical protein